jgi:hypothetical protein
MFASKKNRSNFAVFKTKNAVLFAIVGFFIATNIKGYQPLAGLPQCKLSKCSWSNKGGGSLSFCKNFNNSNFSAK